MDLASTSKDGGNEEFYENYSKEIKAYEKLERDFQEVNIILRHYY